MLDKDSDDKLDVSNVLFSTITAMKTIPSLIYTGPVVPLFEELAKDTWTRLRYASALAISQGEETITDINLLALKMANIADLQVWKCPKNLEKERGIDWEWWIGSNRIGWLGYAVQAKKLAGKSYEHLNHEVTIAKTPAGQVQKVFQLELLEQYAYHTPIKRIPLYCLYNFVPSAILNPITSPSNVIWHCPLPFDEQQLGCTVTPLRVVKAAVNAPPRSRSKTFESIHRDPATIPWRCLVRCTQVLNLYQQGSGDDAQLGPFQVYPTLPSIVSQLYQSGNQSSVNQLEGIFNQIMARRIMITTLDDRYLERTQASNPIEGNDQSLPIIRKFS